MPYTTDPDVRLRFQFNDTVQVPPELIAQAIEDAHTELLRFLDPARDTGSPDGALILGETLLAGANVCRALAAKDALDQKRISVGGQRIDDGPRLQSLMTVAAAAVEQAWTHLEAYLLDRPVLAPAQTTASGAVLGEE